MQDDGEMTAVMRKATDTHLSKCKRWRGGPPVRRVASVHACEMGDYALVAAKNQDGTAQLIVVGPDVNSVLIADSYSAAILILLRLRILIAAKGQ